jgi:hypothetical protein
MSSAAPLSDVAPHAPCDVYVPRWNSRYSSPCLRRVPSLRQSSLDRPERTSSGASCRGPCAPRGRGRSPRPSGPCARAAPRGARSPPRGSAAAAAAISPLLPAQETTAHVLEHLRERPAAAVAVPEHEQRGRAALEVLVVRHALVHVADGRLRRVRVWRARQARTETDARIAGVPTGVMWHSTCEPSMPTQLNVECGKVLLRAGQPVLSSSSSPAYMLFLSTNISTHTPHTPARPLTSSASA